MNKARVLTSDEIEQVTGGVAPLIPVVVAFGKGLAAGAAAGAVVATVLDALDIGNFKVN